MTIDLVSRRDATLEWWFLHGILEGESLPRRAFMVSVFRKAGSSTGLPDGYMLLLNTLDFATGAHACRSEVSPSFEEHLLAGLEDREALAAVDDHAVEAYASEVRARGVPAPFVARTAEVVLHDTPFRLAWGDVVLGADDEHIDLRFELPGDGRLCTLRAMPEAPWVESRDVLAGSDGAMSLLTCPRLGLTGDVDGQAVAGRGWIDRQWGDYDWFASHRSNGRMVGWVWFGINLESGADLIAWQRIDMETREALSAGAILVRPGEPPRETDGVRFEPKRVWRSERSMMSYPVTWDVEVPAFDLRLHVEPRADDQELPVYGLTNTVWEGAGRAAGTLGGRAVEGAARIELQGYGCVLDFEAYQARWVDRIDAVIKDFLPERIDAERLASWIGEPRWSYDAEAQTAMLAAPAWDLLARGGKHWRPIYCYLLADVLGFDIRPYESLVAVMPELIHNGSVIIDDVEDDSAARRGDESLHRRYGLPTAVNLGNTLYCLPLLTLRDHPELTVAQREEIYALANGMFVRSHVGQAQDLHWAKHAGTHDEAFWLGAGLGDRILQAHALKSAAAVRALTEVACVIGKIEGGVRAVCARFGEAWGTAFQVVDDAKNFSAHPSWGKVRGEDIAAGKVTYATWNAVRMLAGNERAELIGILQNEACRTSEAGLARGVQLVEQSGALDACRAKARALVEEDWPAFRDAVPHSLAKINFRMFITSVLDLPLDM